MVDSDSEESASAESQTSSQDKSGAETDILSPRLSENSEAHSLSNQQQQRSITLELVPFGKSSDSP